MSFARFSWCTGTRKTRAPRRSATARTCCVLCATVLLSTTLCVAGRSDELSNAQPSRPLIAPDSVAEELPALVAETGALAVDPLAIEETAADDSQGGTRADAESLILPGSTQLQWVATTAEGVSETVVERLDPSAEAFSFIASAASEASGFVDRELVAGRTYCYRVRSFWAGSLVHSMRTCRSARFEY